MLGLAPTLSTCTKVSLMQDAYALVIRESFSTIHFILAFIEFIDITLYRCLIQSDLTFCARCLRANILLKLQEKENLKLVPP